MTELKVTILGCGTSTGVPRLPDDWGSCDPLNPKNRRSRASVLVEHDGTTLLVDCGPDMRQQLLAAGVKKLDGVLITHDHADHTHGIDDLRGYVMERRAEMPIHAPKEALVRLKLRFDYIFKGRQGYPPICEGFVIDGPVRIGSIEAIPFLQQHGPIWSLGFRFGDIAYSTDVSDLPEESFAALEGVRVWIVDALRDKPHPTHTHLEKTLSWIARVKPERAILTHMSNRMDYESLRAKLPAGVEPGYDGMIVTV